MDQEDHVSYWLYPVTSHKLNPVDTLAAVYSLVAPYTRCWVWHSQPFVLSIVQEKYTWHLHGVLDYGENVLDEWFVVSLLMKVTSELTSLVARINDSDGEILLIEAAPFLPSWAAEPSVAEGRVFIYRGQVHLIPICSSPGNISPLPIGAMPHPNSAAEVIATYPNVTRASKKVQDAIKCRLESLPEDTMINHHKTNASIPRGLAILLANDNTLLARLTKAVLERDKIDAKACKQMENVKQQDIITCSLTFSKCLYAMLSGVQLQPYKSSNWLLNDSKHETLGFKLATGLQILISRCNREESVDNTTGFNEFSNRLDQLGFFQGELKGSAKHTQLMDSCKLFWKHSNAMGQDSSQMNILNDYIKASSSSELPNNYFLLRIPPGPEDSEDWLNINQNSLDAMLEAQFGVAAGTKSENNSIPDEINKFLTKMSDMTGVEHEDGISLDSEEKMVEKMKILMSKMDGTDHLSGEDSSASSDDEICGEDDAVMADYLKDMDNEVMEKAADRKEAPDLDNPIDIDANVLNNLLKSYSAQIDVGGHGPASSLLQSLHINPGPPN